MALETTTLNQVKIFAFKLLILIAVFFVFDFIVGAALRHFYFRQKSGVEYETIYAMEKANEDVLVFGSSRASHHYVSKSFETILGKSFHNVGRENNFVLYSNALLRTITLRHIPKIVILDLNYREFEKTDRHYDYLSSLLPFYKNHPEIRPIIEMRSRYEKLKFVSNIYPFNSLAPTIAVGYLGLKKGLEDFHGYIPLHRVMSDSAQVIRTSDKYPIDSNKVAVFESFVQLCKDKGIKLYVVCSPYYDIIEHSDSTINLAKQIAIKNDVCFWDYSKNRYFVGKASFFDDNTHLNNGSATSFSDSIALRIRADAMLTQKLTALGEK
jgi:hypothetical protein